MKIINRQGLHARPAMEFVEAASKFLSDVRVRYEDEDADGKSVMELMMLAATAGTEIEVVCVGEDAHDALNHLATLVKQGFNEEDE